MTVTKQAIMAAARHCIALDESGQFPANSLLGLFEVETAPAAAAPRITTATVEFIPRAGARKTGSTGGDGLVGVRLLLETDSADGRKAGGEENYLLEFDSARSAAVPTRADVEMAATAASTMTAGNPAEAQIAISGLAAWNLMMVSSSAQENAEQARAVLVDVEVGAAFGSQGDWYTVRETVALTVGGVGYGTDDGSTGSFLSASFDWQPTSGLWAKLDGHLVTDVKVFAATQSTPIESEEPLLLLHATLCKRASSVGSRGRGVTTEAAATSVDALRATLVPHAEQENYVRQRRLGQEADPVVSEESVAATASSPPLPGPSVTITEIEDSDWWRARDEETYGRGMDAVNALPRLAGWKPGDWKKRRERRRKQELERERRRAEKTARRRSTREGDGGRREATSRKGEGIKDRREEKWRGVKGVWRAIGRGWRQARQKFSRRKTRD